MVPQSFDFTQLSPAERLHLVEAIWESLHDDAPAMPLSAEERAELDRRHAELESGAVRSLSLDELKASLSR